MSGRGRGVRAKKVPLPLKSRTNSSSSVTEESLGSQSIRAHVENLILKLQKSPQLDDACALIGMISACGKQLQTCQVFITKMILDVNGIIEETEDYQLRVVLLHLLELVASGWQLSRATSAYYEKKVVLPKTCEDAYNAASKLTRDLLELGDIDMIPGRPNGNSPAAVTSPDVTGQQLDTSDVLEGVPSTASPREAASPGFDRVEINNNDKVIEGDELVEAFVKGIGGAVSRLSSSFSAGDLPRSKTSASAGNPTCAGNSPLVGNLAGSDKSSICHPEKMDSLDLLVPVAADSDSPSSKRTLVQAEEEEGMPDEAKSQILPSSTTCKILPTLHETRATSKDCGKVDFTNDSESLLRQEEKAKVFERFMKVRGDVIIHLSSDSSSQLEEIYKLLSMHLTPALNRGAISSIHSQNKLTYSRDFLLQCSSSCHARKPPTNWNVLSKQFPEICLQDPKSSCVQSNSFPCARNAVRRSSCNSSRSSSSYTRIATLSVDESCNGQDDERASAHV